MNSVTAPAAPAQSIIEGDAALAALVASPEVAALLERLRLAQNATEADGTWETRTGTRVESAWGHLRMALEAAGARF